MVSIQHNDASIQPYNDFFAFNQDRVELAERERDLAIAAYQALQAEMDGLKAEKSQLKVELERTRMQLQRVLPEVEEAKALRKRVSSIQAICAIPHEKLGPNAKITWIVAPDQVSYPASVLGGNPDEMITSMKQWNKAIGGNENNTNRVRTDLDALEAVGVVERIPVKLPDGRELHRVEVSEMHTNHPRMIKAEKERPHNGGDKRCPQCGKFCKKRLKIYFECLECGLDFDMDMNPVDHSEVVPKVARQKKTVKRASEEDEFAAMMDNAAWLKS